MAKPVKATPILRGRAAREFDKKVEAGLKKPTGLVETPNLDAAREAVKKYAIQGKE